MCVDCGTYKSALAIDRNAIYMGEYWSLQNDHNTIAEHQHNVAIHREHDLTKNEFTLQAIKTQLRGCALEIACAPGNLLNDLQNKADFKRVIGIEPNPKYQSEILGIAGPKTELLIGFFPTATEILKDGCCDLIIGLDIFEHIDDPVPFLAECRRLLKFGGQLLLMTPLMHDKFDPRFFHAIEHVWIHSVRHIEQLLADGFSPPRYSAWTTGHEMISAYAV